MFPIGFHVAFFCIFFSDSYVPPENEIVSH